MTVHLQLQLVAPSPWRKQALCATLADPDDMFPTPGDLDGQIAAKTVCVMCPARPDCLDWALETDQQYGVLGGLTETERADLGGHRPPTDPDVQDDARPRRRSPGEERPPCGTEAGWREHQRRHEPVCAQCAAARNPKKKMGAPFQPIDHGTYKGARQHRYRKDPVCEDCLAAERDYNNERRVHHRKAVAA